MEKRKRQKWSRETRGCVQFGIGRPNEDQRHSLLYAALSRLLQTAEDGLEKELLIRAPIERLISPSERRNV